MGKCALLMISGRPKGLTEAPFLFKDKSILSSWASQSYQTFKQVSKLLHQAMYTDGPLMEHFPLTLIKLSKQH